MGNARTGSSHLMSLLDDHPDIAAWDGELFDLGEEFDRSGYTDPAAFLTDCVFQVPVRVVGFKLLADALEYRPAMWALLRVFDMRLLHTVRQNRLDSYLSFQLASLNGAFNNWYGDYRLDQVTLDPVQCHIWFGLTAERDETIRFMAADTGLRRLEIEFEQLAAEVPVVLDFLGVERQPLHSKLLRQRRGPQSQHIVNYAELQRHFSGTEFAEYFTG
jgi:hypothetical protein